VMQDAMACMLGIQCTMFHTESEACKQVHRIYMQ